MAGFQPEVPIGDGAQDYIEITGIMGIGRERKIIVRKLGRYMIEHDGYPEIGVVICDCPVRGRDAGLPFIRK